MRKKKQGPIVRLVHKIMFFVVVVTALCFSLQFIRVGIKFKYWLLSLGYFIIYAANNWKRDKDQAIHYKDEVHHVILPEEHETDWHPGEKKEWILDRQNTESSSWI